jgi:Phospholipase_D-nuclease N-terminal
MGMSNAVDRYRRLSPRARRALWAALAAEAVLVAVAQRDIHRRPAARIRGPKLLWRLVATLNFVGPAAYYALGRR